MECEAISLEVTFVVDVPYVPETENFEWPAVCQSRYGWVTAFILLQMSAFFGCKIAYSE
jgi:hypothetical protein